MTAPLAWPLDIPSFMSKVEPHSRMYVMDKDLVTLEGQAREALSVLSNLDALVSAAQSAVQSLQLCDPFLTRAMLEIGEVSRTYVRLPWRSYTKSLR